MNVIFRFSPTRPRARSKHIARTILTLASLWILEVTCAHRASAEDWPEFRGPSGQGHATKISAPIPWDLTQQTRWKKPIPGKGWSSPIVYRGRLYLTTAVLSEEDPPQRRSLRALCLDATNGETIWDIEVFSKEIAPDEKIHKKNSFASPTPLTDGERLYVHFGPDGTAALDFDGKLIWANREIQFNSQHGGGGSPILSGNLLFFHCDGVDEPFVIALSRATGEVAWKTLRPKTDGQRFSFATPLEIEVAGKKQLISPASHMVCSYEPETGRELWRVHYPNKWSIIPRPVFSHGLVFVCTGYEGPAELLAIRPDGEGDVTETHVAWRTDENVSHSPSPLIVGDELYMMSDNGIASCRDVVTGNLHWRHRIGGNYSASPVYADGKIFFQSEQGVGTVIEAAREFKELGKNDFQEQTLASYAVADGAVYVRTESQLYRIE